MPELPEVEVVRRGLTARVAGRVVSDVIVRAPMLRWPVPADLRLQLTGNRLDTVDRRGKYLMVRFAHGTLMIHLGMSGRLTVVPAGTPLRTHDHVDLVLDDLVMRLNDPRRFGAVLWHPGSAAAADAHPLVASLGIEPFDPRFDGRLLFAATRGRAMAIKSLLMGGQVVVGVGNIYASESLFMAGIHPARAAGRIGLARYERLAQAIREVLAKAIVSGGSTLRDFVGADGGTGHFQQAFRVYDREGLPCPVCATPIVRLVQQQRSTYYCPRCQR